MASTLRKRLGRNKTNRPKLSRKEYIFVEEGKVQGLEILISILGACSELECMSCFSSSPESTKASEERSGLDEN